MPIDHALAARAVKALKDGGKRAGDAKRQAFANAYASGIRRTGKLAEAAGLSIPTAREWRTYLDSALAIQEHAQSFENQDLPAARGELELVLSRAMRVAEKEGRLSELASLTERYAKLQGFNAPDRIQQESVQLVVQLTGGIENTDALLLEQFQRSAKAGTLPPQLQALAAAATEATPSEGSPTTATPIPDDAKSTDD